MPRTVTMSARARRRARARGDLPMHGNTRVVLWDERTRRLHDTKPRAAQLGSYLRAHPYLHVYDPAEHALARAPRRLRLNGSQTPSPLRPTARRGDTSSTPVGFWDLNFADETHSPAASSTSAPETRAAVSSSSFGSKSPAVYRKDIFVPSALAS